MVSITSAKIIELQAGKKIELPPDFIEALSTEEAEHALAIFSPSSRMIRIIPTKSEEVYKVSIEIGELTPDFLQKMGSIFMKHRLKTAYSTGICYHADICVYEGYIAGSELKNISIDILKEELGDIEGVTNVTVEVLVLPKV
ncbi:MAG: hypothetical protein ACETVN_02885 [Asgard group archaeon]